MANQRILLKHKLLPDYHLVIATRLGDSFREPAVESKEINEFHERVFTAWLNTVGEPHVEHYDKGYYVEPEI